jgi:hypothetical protein
MHNLPDQSHEHDEWVERIARPLRRPETLDPTFESRLMSAIRAEAARAGARRVAALPRTTAAPDATWRARPRTAWRWFLDPQTLRVSPAAGLAVAAGLAALVILAADRLGASLAGHQSRIHSTASYQQPDTVRYVQFVLVAPSASRVSLVGDFNDWNPAAAPLRPTRTSGGVWTISVPLSIGRHQYAFIVDGTRWMTDPAAPTAVEDDFGVPNSVVTVGERAS